MLVTDRSLCPGGSLTARVARAVAGGVDIVQLRERDMLAGELLSLALELREATEGRSLLVVNDRADVALAAGADGLHLPERGLPVAAARRLLGEGRLVGRSVHSLAEAVRAAEEGADYLVVGSIYATRSHPGASPAGLGLLREVAARVSLPVLAIGGITAERVAEVVQAGASGVAVISAVLGQPEAEEAARRLGRALRQAWSRAGSTVAPP